MHRPAFPRIELEICAANFASALAAQEGGADRIELCENLGEGGCTPSLGMITEVRAALRIGVHVLIRPRGGDFVYSAAEKRLMLRDADAALAAGADGIVSGALNRSGEVDSDFLRELRVMTQGRTLTFHRAFDVLKNDVSGAQCQTLEMLIGHGVDRLLTSGRAAHALDGATFIAQCVRQAGDRLRIMAGAGVREDNLIPLLKTSGVRDLHTSAKATIHSASSESFATLPGLASCYSASNAETIRRLRQQIDRYSAAAPAVQK